MESINHPAHYGGDTVYEAIKVIEAWRLCFHTGNAVKYIARAGRKDPSKEAEDLRKAVWYLERKIAALEQKREKEGPVSVGQFDSIWRCCSCGETNVGAGPRWRWNGKTWEHQCNHPQAGHFPAESCESGSSPDEPGM